LAKLTPGLMHSGIITCPQDASPGPVAVLLTNHHRFIVVDPELPDAMPLGIISAYNIIGKLARPEFGWH